MFAAALQGVLWSPEGRSAPCQGGKGAFSRSLLLPTSGYLLTLSGSESQVSMRWVVRRLRFADAASNPKSDLPPSQQLHPHESTWRRELCLSPSRIPGALSAVRGATCDALSDRTYSGLMSPRTTLRARSTVAPLFRNYSRNDCSLSDVICLYERDQALRGSPEPNCHVAFDA